MKFSTPLRFAFIWPAALAACGVHGQVDELFKIGPVTTGMHKNEITRLLGPADRTSMHDGFVREFLYFDQMTVRLDEDLLVSGVTSVSRKYCLNGNVCPGMDWDDAIGVTRGMRHASSSPNKIVLIGDGCHATVKEESEVVRSVEFDCPP